MSGKIPVQVFSPGPKTLTIAVALLFLLVLSVVLMRVPRKEKSLMVYALAIAGNGKWVAGGTSDGTIRIWDLSDRQLPNKTLEFERGLNDLRFSVADKYLAVANRNITLVPLQAQDERVVLRDDDANYGTVQFSADGGSIVTVNGRGTVLTIDLESRAALPGHCCTSIWGDVDFTPNGTGVVWAGHWPGLWDLRAGTLAGRLTESWQVMTFGPIAWGTGGTVFMGSQDGRVYEWGVEPRKLLRRSPAQPGYVHSIAVIGGSGWIAYAPSNGPVHLWHPETGESRVAGDARTTSNLVFDPTRNRTALGTAAGTVEFWDLVQGRILQTLY